MKKLFLIIAVAAIAFACEGPMGPMGPQGPAGNANKVYFDDIELGEDDWKRAYDDAGVYYYGVIDMPELTPAILYSGLYQLTWRSRDNNVEFREGLAVTIYHNDDNGRWSETISCIYSVGSVEVQIRYSDMAEDVTPTRYMEFQFVAFW